MATKKPTTAVILWEQEMKAAAVQQAASEKVYEGFKRIVIKGGQMTVDDSPVAGNTLDVVILGAVHLNEWYAGAYTPGTPTVPGCYAYGDNTLPAEELEEAMAPLDAVDDKQSESCSTCALNVMGSADVGKGKACKNIRRLVLMTEDSLESADTIKDAEERTLSVPVMSVKGWSKYLKDVLAADLGRPYYGVVTTVKVIPDAKAQWLVTFTFKELIDFDQQTWNAMKAKVASVGKSIGSPYPSQADLDSKAPPAKAFGKAAPAVKKSVGKAKY